MLEWRRRREPSMAMLWLSPLIAIGLTMLAGMLVFTAMGYDGFHAVGYYMSVAALVSLIGLAFITLRDRQ